VRVPNHRKSAYAALLWLIRNSAAKLLKIKKSSFVEQVMQKRRSLLLWPLLASLATSMNAAAADATVDGEKGIVLGVQGGYADIKWSQFDDSKSVNGYVAYRFLDWFGLEAGVASLGDFDVKGGNSSLDDVTLKYAGFHFHGNSGFFGMSATAMVGAYQSELKRTCDNCASSDDKSTDSGFTYSVRLGIPVADFLDITLGWQNFYKVEEDTEFNLYQAGVEFHF